MNRKTCTLAQLHRSSAAHHEPYLAAVDLYLQVDLHLHVLVRFDAC
jgi:hypothetical protein